MARRIRGVALVVRNPFGEILVLQEFESKPHLGKYPGMYSIPMETCEPGERQTVALERLVREELLGMPTPLVIVDSSIGVYRIVPHVWAWLYVCGVQGRELPAGENEEVGNFEWMEPERVLHLWLRQGAKEMLADYVNGRTGVVCRHCEAVTTPDVRSTA